MPLGRAVAVSCGVLVSCRAQNVPRTGHKGAVPVNVTTSVMMVSVSVYLILVTELDIRSSLVVKLETVLVVTALVVSVCRHIRMSQMNTLEPGV